MYIIKEKPEDFVVTEISSVEIEEKGKYAYFRLKKKNWNTLDAVKRVARGIGVKEKEVGFAGNKDKKAVTSQMISVLSGKKEKVEGLSLEGITLEFVGYGSEKITLGDLIGNKFEIVIRGVEDVVGKDKVVNYFGEQRFGRNNVAVGRALIKKEFSEACSLLELEVSRNDYIGALKTIPKRLLRLYINAFQSWLWNETVDSSAEEWPLVGWDTDLAGFDSIKEKLNVEGVSVKDFLIKQIPELSLEGEMRNVWLSVQDFKVLEKGKDFVKVSFTLRKGSYATEVIRQIVN